MKFNIKKIGSILASGIMLAGTIGFAAAASYPSPFVVTGTEDGAVVVGANAATTDWAAAIDVQTKLNALVSTTGGGSSISGGDSFKFEKVSTKFHIGRGLLDVVSVAIEEDKMPNLLADGKFVDDDNDEFDFTQKIQMANISLIMFDDNDYAEDTPTVGFRLANGENILNYTITFSDEPRWDDLTTSTIPIMGKNYYVLTTDLTTNNTLTLLDSAVDTVLGEGETTTIEVDGKAYECSVAFISSTETKLIINGETTTSLQEQQTQKLSDASYIGIKDILYSSKDTGVSKVEFSIGKGKLKLTDGSDVEINDDTVSSLTANVTEAGNTIKRIGITWSADEDMFITEDSTITMPQFEGVKLTFGGMVYPAKELIKVEADGSNSIMLKNFPLKDSVEDINILWTNSSGAYNGTGKDVDNTLRTPGGSSNGAIANVNASTSVYTENEWCNNGSLANLTFDTDTDDYFVASWNDSTSSESYLMRTTNFKTESNIPKTTFQYKKDTVWTDVKTDARNGTTFSLGNVEIRVGPIDKTNKRVVVERGNNQVEFHTLWSKEGLKVYLPWINSTVYPNTTGNGSVWNTFGLDGTLQQMKEVDYEGILFSQMFKLTDNGTYEEGANTQNETGETYNLLIREEDKDENVGAGNLLNITLGETSSNSETTVSDIIGEVPSFDEQGDTDVYRSFTYSALGSELLWDKSGDQYKLQIEYHGDESYGELYLSSPESVITPGSSTAGGQVVVIKDSEISSASSKNLIVVGGSCINTVAAKILGSTTPLCTSAFTEKTGVGAGQYIIKTVESPYNAAKVAMLVAGYEAADTVNAVAKAVEGATSDKDTEQVYPIVSA